MRFKGIFILVMSFFSLNLKAQDTLTVQDAIAIALKNNYSIIIAGNQAEIAGVNNTILNTSAIPTITAEGSRNYSITDTRQELFGGEVRERSSARTDNLSGNITLNWGIFNGFTAVITKNALTRLEELGELEYRNTVENTINQVLASYYGILQQEKVLDYILQTISLSRRRLDLARAKYEIGSASEFSALQSSVDLNADTAAYINQLIILQQSKAELNALLGRTPETPVFVTGGIEIDTSLNYPELENEIIVNNSNLLAQRQRVEIARLNVRGAKAAYLPNLSAYGGYGYNNSNSEVGIFRTNRSVGTNYGLVFSYNIFNGFNLRRNVQTSRIMLESEETRAMETETAIRQNLFSIFQEYAGTLEIVKMETSNVETARRNLDIAYTMYNVGKMSDIDFRQIQESVLIAENRLLNAQYAAKIAETELKRLAGRLNVL